MHCRHYFKERAYDYYKGMTKELGCIDIGMVSGTSTGTNTEVHHFLKKLGYDTWGVRRLIN